MNLELHVQKGGVVSATTKRISVFCFPTFDEGELIGNITGDDIKFALNEAGFDIVDLHERRTEEILKQNKLS